jgi:hypothetical protein
MEIRFVKKLVHPDGEDFVIWHPTADVYCPVLCDDDVPPDPMWLAMQLHPETATDIGNLRWEYTGKAYDETGQPVEFELTQD